MIMEQQRAAPPADRTSSAHEWTSLVRGVPSPTFRSLSHAECDALLARNHVGRIAFVLRDRVDIQPIHYAYEAGWLFGRTSEGGKLMTLAHNHWLAFEVDEVRGVFDWQSVVVHGTFHRIDPDGPPAERGAAARAVHLLREIVPETYTAGDPAAFRTVLFRISIGEVTGRAASSVAAADAAAQARARAFASTADPRRHPTPPGPSSSTDLTGW